jgi:hypothetical protein
VSTIAERVARGAALLDEREPGWWQRIDLSKLDLASTCRCVLGQLFSIADDNWPPNNGYWSGLARFGLRESASEAISGSAGSHGFASIRNEDYDALDAEWRRVIEARRSA